MKQYFFVVMFAMSVSSACIAQQEEKDIMKATPPAAAKAAFAKAFPGATKVKWEKEDAGYEAEFRQNGKAMSADFDGKGSLLETEETIKESELPAMVLQYLKEKYKGAKIKEAAKITKVNGEVNYEAEVNKIDVMFDASGKFLKESKD